MPPGTTCCLQHAVHLLQGIARRARTDDRHQKSMSTSAGRLSEPFQMTVFVEGFIGFAHRASSFTGRGAYTANECGLMLRLGVVIPGRTTVGKQQRPPPAGDASPGVWTSAWPGSPTSSYRSI